MAKRKEEKRKALNTPLYVEDKPKSIVSEKLRGIRSNIMFSNAEEIKSVLITSENRQLGKVLCLRMLRSLMRKLDIKH